VVIIKAVQDCHRRHGKYLCGNAARAGSTKHGLGRSAAVAAGTPRCSREREWLIAHLGRGLSPRQLRFWSHVLALPNRQVGAWMHTGQANTWSRRDIRQPLFTGES
jgi:hypothetical protein